MTPSTNRLPFQRKNYLLMIIGICVIILGFIAMSLDREPYGFGFLGITLGPVMIVLGFGIQFFAILWEKKDKPNEGK
jgi:hypothetical protein